MVDADSIRYCGICCGGFSLFAIVFLLAIGSLIGSGSDTIHVSEHDRDSASNTCYYGALAYFFTFVLSIGCFFGPMFIKRNADLDQMRMRGDGRGNTRQFQRNAQL